MPSSRLPTGQTRWVLTFILLTHVLLIGALALVLSLIASKSSSSPTTTTTLFLGLSCVSWATGVLWSRRKVGSALDAARIEGRDLSRFRTEVLITLTFLEFPTLLIFTDALIRGGVGYYPWAACVSAVLMVVLTWGPISRSAGL